MAPIALTGDVFHADIFGLSPGALEESGLKAKVIVISPSALDDLDFQAKLSGALDKLSEEDDTESDSDESESLSERLKEIRADCNEHEKMLLGGVIMPGEKPPRRSFKLLMTPDNIHTTFSDVRVAPSTIQALRNLTTLPLIRPDAFTYGILAKDKILGVLLHGPPGTGKTLLAKAVAKESGATVLEVSGADVLQQYVGEGEKVVRAIFTLARKLDPCVIFIDEADSVFRCRSKGESQYHRDLINQFLREWDGVTGSDSKAGFVMMATNRPSDIDPAVLRRLPRRILVDLPTVEDREAILRIHLKDEILGPDVNLTALARSTPLFTGSDLKSLCVAAAFACLYEEVYGTGKVPSETPNGEARLPNVAKKKKVKKDCPRRTLHTRHFDKAMEEINANVNTEEIDANVNTSSISNTKQSGKLMFQYRPLVLSSKEIRLLELQPSLSPSSDIHLTLRIASLDDPPPFFALSYAWGDPNPARTVRLDGHAFTVTPNLFAFFQRFRHAKEPRLLWVDAVCINQLDHNERSLQVILMGSIFSTAVATLLWLGDEAEDSGKAMYLLHIFRTITAETPWEMVIYLFTDIFDQHWMALRKIFSRPYWSRVWIMQEVLLSSRALVCCGKACSPWPIVSYLLSLDYTDFIGKARCDSAVSAMLNPDILRAKALASMSQKRREGQSLTLLEALVLGRQRNATDVRDYVYGTLALTSGHILMSPDYQQSVQRVYRDLAKRFIETDNNLDVLTACKYCSDCLRAIELYEISQKIVPSINADLELGKTMCGIRGEVDIRTLPSWVPNWTVKDTNIQDYLVLLNHQACYFRAAGDTKAKVSFVEDRDKDKMVVTGVLLDEIVRIVRISSLEKTSDSEANTIFETKSLVTSETWLQWCNHVEVNSIFARMPEMWLQWCTHTKDGTHQYGDEEGQKEAFWNTMICGRQSNGMKADYHAQRNGAWEFVFGWRDDIPRDNRLTMASMLLTGSKMRTFFVTRQGYMGVGPNCLGKGDIVCVFLGGKVPFVLHREHSEYLLLGESYVHGIMEGEIIEEVARGERHIEEFTLI
jgi:SpoVK/Ycf46/Vps4 family AAA+-type ATPase